MEYLAWDKMLEIVANRDAKIKSLQQKEVELLTIIMKREDQIKALIQHISELEMDKKKTASQ